jgi:hypothetical protein
MQQFQMQNFALQKSACGGLLQSKVLQGCTPFGHATLQNRFEFGIAEDHVSSIARSWNSRQDKIWDFTAAA